MFRQKFDTNSRLDGFNNWDNLSQAVTKHCSQRNHRAACITHIAVMCDKTSNHELIKRSRYIVTKENAKALKLLGYLRRIIDTLRYLSSEFCVL